jgi:hypothetical protein
VPGDLLDFPDVVIQQDVGEFVAYVAEQVCGRRPIWVRVRSASRSA